MPTPSDLARGSHVDFYVVLNNCDHFATWFKTGMSDSEQMYALWQSALNPMTYRWMRGADFLTNLFDCM